MKKHTKVLTIAGAILCLAGIVVSTAAVAAVGFDVARFDTMEQAQMKSYSLDTQGITAIRFSSEGREVRVEPSPDGQIHVQYYEDKYDRYHFDTSDGAFTMDHTRKDVWRAYVNFNFFFGFRRLSEGLVLQVPEGFNGTLKVSAKNAQIQAAGLPEMAEVNFTASNAAIKTQNLSAEKIGIKTTNGSVNAAELYGQIEIQSSNASILAKNCSGENLKAITTNGRINAENVAMNGEAFLQTTNAQIVLEGVRAQNVTTQTTNGSIRAQDVASAATLDFHTTNASLSIERCSAQDRITAQSTNGQIKVEALSSPGIFLSTTNASINGTVQGNESEYNITASTTNGKSSLANRVVQNSGKQLHASTKNGSIALAFSAE